MELRSLMFLAVAACAATGCSRGGVETPRAYDLLLRGGTIYDGSGGAPSVGDLAISGDRIVAIGELTEGSAETELDVTGLAVAPGFINMLSWAVSSLMVDGRAMSDVKQGVTLEVFGEGWSMGPLTEASRSYWQERQGDLSFSIDWTTLEEFLEGLEARGVSVNVASFVGATTVRVNTVGFENRKASATELAEMQAQVRQAMEEGALGVGSSLIYAPAYFADTAELIALAEAAAPYGGLYISHLRSEGNHFEEAVDELLTIAREADVPAEIYHLKAAGRENWPKLEAVYRKIEAARSEGLAITADMYTYPASSTGLNAAMPLWVQEGGHDAWVSRLQEPKLRARVIAEMNTPSEEWDNRFLQAGPEGILLVEFQSEALKPLTGRTLAEVAEARGTSAAETAVDLVVEDDSRVGVVYFIMNEEQVRDKIRQPWVSFGSDAGAPSAEGVFVRSSTHPRAYGNFARLLGRYVRDEQVISLEEAVHRLTALPAANLKIGDRGRLEVGYFADLVVFEPATISDHATFADPHRYASGVVHVFVNGEQVLSHGEHTGATPGRVVRGPGWTGRPLSGTTETTRKRSASPSG